MVKKKVITNRILVGLGLSAAAVRSAGAEPACRPSVILAGDPTLIAAIEDKLHSKSITISFDGCPSGRVDIRRNKDSIVMAITDADGRQASRTVGDPATAAALIESFMIVEDPPVRAKQPVVAAVVVAASIEPTRTPIDSEQPALLAVDRRSPSARGALSMTAESSIATDKSLWYGARASGCVRFESVCVGSIGRFARDSGIGAGAATSESSRSGAVLLLAADYTIARDGLSITPGVAMGVGWMRVRRSYLDGTGNTVEVDTGGVRAEAHIAATIPIGHLLSVRVGAAIEVTPTAHTQPFKDATGEAPGEPRGFARVELGLELRRP